MKKPEDVSLPRIYSINLGDTMNKFNIFADNLQNVSDLVSRLFAGIIGVLQ